MILSSLRRSGVERSCAFPIGSPHQNQRDQRSSSSDQLLKNGNPRRQPLSAVLLAVSAIFDSTIFDSLICSL